MTANSDTATLVTDVPVANVLVVDDELLFAKAVVRHLQKSGYRCTHAATLAAARDNVMELEPDLILLDMRLPDGSGLDFLRQLRETSSVPVVVMTAYGEVDDAVLAMKYAASDYLKKPLDLDELRMQIAKVLATRELNRQLEYSRAREDASSGRAQLLGNAVCIARVREQIDRIANLAAGTAPPPTILITGETGTGKDVAARLLHQRSARAARPFVHVDCAALPKDLIEAELFGHVKGAFTHAVAERAGLIEAADDGVVFLDEVGEIPLELQAKLLAVLERRQLRRIGSSAERHTSAWFIAATNRDVESMVAAGTLRSDLYFRLKVLALELPPLRQRDDDAALLADHFAREVARRYAAPAARLTAAARQRLSSYSWPGNVRELSHVMERAVLLAGGADIDVDALALPAAHQAESVVPETAALDHMTLDEIEKMMLLRALALSQDNVSEAARRLGITRMAMRYRMEKYGIRACDA